MTILRMVPNAFHISEFATGTNAFAGQHFNGTCTQASAAMCLASQQNDPKRTQQDVVNLMLQMRAEMFERRQCGENGAATIADMATELRNQKADIAVEWDFADPFNHDWIGLLRAHAGLNPILLQLSQANFLCNAQESTQDPGVIFHAIAVMGIADNGYVVGDPNNPTVSQTFDIYPYDVPIDGKFYGLAPAKPCGLIMLA